MVASIGMRIARKDTFSIARFPPIISKSIASATHPQAVPTHITPGRPRLRCPDFSVIVSPVEPKRSTIPNFIALTRKVIIAIIYLPPCFFF